MDKFETLRQMVWCDHAGVTIQSATKGTTHVGLLGGKAVHVVIEEGKVKILCHQCFCDAMQLRFKLT